MDRKIVLKQNILDAFSAVGMRVGQTVMAHCSLSALGYVCGGSQSVIEALLQAVGETGTIMMPTQSWKNRRYVQSRRLFRTPHGGDTPATDHELKVIGLIPNHKNTVTLTCIVQDGASRTSTFTVETPALRGEEEERLAVTAGESNTPLADAPSASGSHMV